MAQRGYLVFYTTARAEDPPRVLAGLLKLIRPESFSALRSLGEDKEWEYFQTRCRARRDSIVVTDEDPVPWEWEVVVSDEDPAPSEQVGLGCPVDDLPSFYRDGVSLRMELFSALGDSLQDAIERRIPVAIRGDFSPCELYVRIGFHDIYEAVEYPEGYLFARAFLSVALGGYGTPADWDEMRQQVFMVPELREMKKELEAVTGPLEQCIYWV